MKVLLTYLTLSDATLAGVLGHLVTGCKSGSLGSTFSPCWPGCVLGQFFSVIFGWKSGYHVKFFYFVRLSFPWFSLWQKRQDFVEACFCLYPLVVGLSTSLDPSLIHETKRKLREPAIMLFLGS